jgi:hypothetical protein
MTPLRAIPTEERENRRRKYLSREIGLEKKRTQNRSDIEERRRGL